MKTNNYRISRHSRLLMVGLILLTLGCTKDQILTTDPIIKAKNSIIGEWEWIKTINAWTQEERNPETEGYTASIKFNTNDTVEYYKNESLTNIYPYELRYRINDLINPNSDSTIVLVINNGTESFFSTDNGSLIINQAYVDGPIDYYERKKEKNVR